MTNDDEDTQELLKAFRALRRESAMQSETLQPCPWTPPEEAWSGLARDLVMWLDMQPHTPRTLFEHLERLGREIPDWLRNEPEMQALDHVPSKGTRAVLIYRAMLSALPRAIVESSDAMVEALKKICLIAENAGEFTDKECWETMWNEARVALRFMGHE